MITKGGDTNMTNDDQRGLASASDDTKQRVSKAGGDARSQQLGTAGYQKLGHKGGKASQDSGNGHQLTDDDRSKGGSMSGGNFKNDPQRASDVASNRE